MKILHSSDWHADRSTSGIPRFEDIKTAVAETVETAIKERVDLYCFTGDLSDPDSGPIILRCAELAIWAAIELEKEGIESWWIPGNHDVVEDGSGTTVLSPMRELQDDLIRVFEQPKVVELPKVKPYRLNRDEYKSAIVLPYVATSHAYEPAEFVKECRKKLDVYMGRPAGHKVVVLGHMTSLAGAVEGEETREMSRGRSMRFPIELCDPSWLLLNGHWHDRQDVEFEGRTVHVCGSLARLTFGEEKNVPSYSIYEL